MDDLSVDRSDAVYLTDISPSDKPWDCHKQQSRIVSGLYDLVGYEKYSKRIWECAQSLEFALKRDEQGTIKLKLHAARFCRARWCPVCLWRRTLMWKARFIKALPRILCDHPKARFVFLTLTVRNCPLNDLREVLQDMNRAWVRLTQRNQFPALGWLKAVEVTRGKDGQAHPHFHCLLMVKSSYFTHGYLSQITWTELWQDCLRINYIPIVNIKAVKNRKQKQLSEVVNSSVNGTVNGSVNGAIDADLIAGILETIKYTIKVEDLVADPGWLSELTRQMHKLRAISLGGVFKDYLSEDDPEDLIHTDLDEETELEDDDAQFIFNWAEIVRRYAKA